VLKDLQTLVRIKAPCMKWLLVFLGLSSFLALSACVPSNSKRLDYGKWKPRQSYVVFLACVNEITLYDVKSGVAAAQAIESGIKACPISLAAYVDELLEDIKIDGGWSSVKPEVRPQIEAEVLKTARQVLSAAYGA